IPKNIFPVPKNIAAMNYCDSCVRIGSLWRNLSMWLKMPGYDGVNSFKMKGYYQMEDEPQLMHPLLKNNTAFFSNEYSFYRDTIKDIELLNRNSTHLFFKENDKEAIEMVRLESDTLAKATFERFNPDD